MTTLLTKDELKAMKKALRVVKPEWIQKKPGAKGAMVEYIGSSTVMQILNNVVEGEWSFTIHEQWREELYKKANWKDKNDPTLVFAKYVYHVRGSLYIEGLGTRDQYGMKLGVGDAQADGNGYKAAASSCLMKCATMFNVGADLYSEIKVESDMNEQEYQQEQQAQWNQQQAPVMDYNYTQVQMPQPIADPNGVQQGNYQQNYAQQGYVQPQYDQTQYQQQYQQVNDANNNWGNPYPEQQPVNQQWQAPYVEQTPYPQANDYMNQAPVPMPTPQYEQLPTGDTGANGPLTVDDMMQPTPDVWQSSQQAPPMMDQGAGAVQDFPFENVPPKQEEEQPPADPKFFKPENMNWMKSFSDERTRLQLGEDNQLNAMLRDFFENENATIALLTQDNIEKVVRHMMTLQSPGASA